MDIELDDFFYFLTENKKEISKDDLIFSLNNYALNLNNEELQILSEDIRNKHSKSENLNLEDFKNLWKHNSEKNKNSTRESAEHVFNLILETSNSNKNRLGDKITTETLLKAIEMLNIEMKPSDGEDKNEIVKEMIECIDKDEDGQVGLTDFEFLLNKYYESKNGEIVPFTGTENQTNR